MYRLQMTLINLFIQIINNLNYMCFVLNKNFYLLIYDVIVTVQTIAFISYEKREDNNVNIK
jgi:hypothetical protein